MDDGKYLAFLEGKTDTIHKQYMYQYLIIGGGAVIVALLGVAVWWFTTHRKGTGAAVTGSLANSLRDEKAKSDIILGAIQDGLMGDYTLLAVKSLMDGFAAMALAASLGAGVILSAGTVFGYQGALSLLAMLFGVALGVLLGQNTVNLVTQTINDLYFTTTVRELGIQTGVLVKGFCLGLLAALATVIPPAIEAARVEPRAALLRSGLENKARAAVWLVAALGAVLIILGYLVFRLPFDNLIFGFGGTLLVLTGLAMLAAIGMLGLLKALAPVTARMFGYLGRMAPSGPCILPRPESGRFVLSTRRAACCWAFT